MLIYCPVCLPAAEDKHSRRRSEGNDSRMEMRHRQTDIKPEEGGKGGGEGGEGQGEMWTAGVRDKAEGG